MSTDLVLLAINNDPSSSNFELLLAAVSTLPVVGAAAALPKTLQLRRTADGHLHFALLLSNALAILALALFGIAALISIAFDASTGAVLTTLLTGGAFGTISLLIERNSTSAKEFSLQANELEIRTAERRHQIEADDRFRARQLDFIRECGSKIENPDKRDQFWIDVGGIAMTAMTSPTEHRPIEQTVHEELTAKPEQPQAEVGGTEGEPDEQAASPESP